MNILLVSECSGRAINATRRILDQFAERRGERAWQTPITREGLNTLRQLLRKSARKNTAVACHWIRGLNHTELLWIVGNASRFNAQGAVPTNTTRRDVLRNTDENDWHTGEDIGLLAQLAALLHDLGKASVAFQHRLAGRLVERNLYRHEWVSLRLFLTFVGEDDDEGWLRRLASPTVDDDVAWLAAGRYLRDGIDTTAPPFAHLPPLAAAVAWLVLTHHRLPIMPMYEETGEQSWLGRRCRDFDQSGRLHDLLADVRHDWNEVRRQAETKETCAYWSMAGELPVRLPRWRARAAKLAQRLLALRAKPGKGDWLSNPYVMHVARMSLMLADHHYSSLPTDSHERVSGDVGYAIYANTDREGRLKQPLDEHLLGVARNAAMICRSLPDFTAHLPHLVHRTLRKRTRHPAFRWQDKAFDAAEAMRERACAHGAFIVNMASTGRGKTIANARIMYALADPQRGMRCSFAIGLRTLTLQTGRSFQRDLGLQDDEIAIRVGGSANRRLFEYHQRRAERCGSASTQALMEEDGAVFYEGNTEDHPLLRMAMNDERIKYLLSAPVLVCTIDHLMPAAEAQRAGRQIAPMLRLMSGDLVLDEPDDFDLSDLPALTRLVHWAGLLGGRVLLSSATLPPGLVHGLFEAYRRGRIQYQGNRGMGGGQMLPPPPVACLWVDEFKTVAADCREPEQFEAAHADFVAARVGALGKQPPKRRGELLPLSINAKSKERIRRQFAEHARQAILKAHALHAAVDAKTGKRRSFGVVRMANVEPLYDVATELFRLGAPEGIHIHLCVYHSRFPLLLRSAIEHELDTVLDRRGVDDPACSRPNVRKLLEACPERDHVFVVLASPVAEVGRDWSLDWAVVEPSSMRSLIQLAGRVCRHRDPPNEHSNVFIFDTNLKHFERGRPAFVRPGFEEMRDRPGALRLESHALSTLLAPEEYAVIDARSRVQARPLESLRPRTRLVDLEHARLHLVMRASQKGVLNAASIWATPRAALTWALPQQQPFRDDGGCREETLAFLPDDDETRLIPHRVREAPGEKIYTTAGDALEDIDLTASGGPRIAPWMRFDMLALLEPLAEAQNVSLRTAAERFTIANVPLPTDGRLAHWRWHPVLGFTLAG
ncbi:type I-F CRISPR-associated helicase Cas3 [Lysobacter pythonis]|uniref:Type I-F CRISPR-associated helicase Cas3 n=1 Tax=Solilutibacter pythonis TaxID=2483112 RepID=A0A3M2HL23_9GAMM|nr:type I-F CRISPR-associated helicase Cas3f [Lysobacter pythonis]RMH89055.1 type I-F CRISPR-associated helicase Cas3 [Lysobacter pythonis]